MHEADSRTVSSVPERPQQSPASAEGYGMRGAAIVAAAYVGLQLISNVASLRVGRVLGFAVDMGTFCYPFSFTLRDLAHKVLGKKGVTTLIWLSAAICLFASGYFALCTLAPSADTDPAGASMNFAAVFSPMWRLVIASIVAMVVSELADTQVYSWFLRRTQRHEWARVVVSNAVSIPLDNAVFAIGAFGFTLPWPTVWQIFFFNLTVKIIVGLIGAPLIYLVPGKSNRRETGDSK